MLTIGDCVAHASLRFASRTAARCGGASLTYDAIDERCRRLATALGELGVGRGDRVAVLAANCHRYLEAFVSIPAAGRVVVPLNTRLSNAELSAIVDDCTPRLLITDRPPDALGELAAKFDQIVAWPGAYEECLSSVTPRSWDHITGGVTTDDLAALFYTGGTTGRPKGVMLSHENLVTNSFHKTIAVGFDADEVFLAAPAMFHVAGIAPLLSLLGRGARMVFVPGFDAAGSLDTIAAEAVTMMFPVPTMLAAMTAEQRRSPRSLPSLRMLGHAGSAITTSVIAHAASTFPRVELAQFYGATETSSIVSCLHHEESSTAVLGSCGQPVFGVSVRVVDAAGSPVPRGANGEIEVRGRNVMQGYWGQPEATAAALHDGWYRTGDVGHLDDTGHLFVVDRSKDMIVTGAENVYSIEVENVLCAQPGVVEAAVFGVPHDVWGEAVHAVVVVEPVAVEGAEARLQIACRGELAGFKVPKTIEITTSPLPKSGPGKVLKRVLREPHWADRTERI